MKKLLAIIFLSLLILTAGNAGATFYTDDSTFLGANPGLSTISFEGIADPGSWTYPYLSSLTMGGVTFSGQNLVIADKDFSSGDVYGQSSDMLFSDSYGSNLYMSFDPAVDAIGFNLSTGHNNSNVTINLYNGMTLLDTQIVLAINMNNLEWTYVGWDGLGSFDNLSVVIGSYPQYLCIDNVSYSSTSVPEPATMLLLGAGLLGLAGFRKKFFKK